MKGNKRMWSAAQISQLEALAATEPPSELPPSGIMPAAVEPAPLVWPTDPVVAAADASFHEKLDAMAANELIRVFSTRALPIHDGLSVEQALNLVRHTLRDKLGSAAFDSLPVMGSPEGAKHVACLFEETTERFLASKRVPFKTEKDQVRDFEEMRGRLLTQGLAQRVPSFRAAASFQPTGEKDAQGRLLYFGKCHDCGDECSLPFKPHRKMSRPAKCVPCHIGRLINTPDFVFHSPLEINGTAVSWLDCKCFYGSGCSAYTIRSLNEQAGRFNKKFGPGALVFAFGYSNGLHIERTLLLDATPLDLTDLRSAIQRGMPTHS